MQKPAVLQCPRSPLRSTTRRQQCQQCWEPVVRPQRKHGSGQSKGHPCLFCSRCLRFSGQPPTPCKTFRRMSSPPRGKGKSPMILGRGTMSKTVTFNMVPEVFPPSGDQGGGLLAHADGGHNQEESSTKSKLQSSTSGGYSEIKREHGAGQIMMSSVVDMEEFKGKLAELELRATRCGFCPRDERRHGLVKFCIHCHKHLCASCHSLHSHSRLYRHHATVDLTSGFNQALL